MEKHSLKEIVGLLKNRKISKTLFDNLNSICLNDNFQVFHQDVIFFLENNNDLYDIIFADPPYNYEKYTKNITL